MALTLGVHSRIEAVAHDIFRKLDVGNTYINRNIVGAVVGVQPFGGQGLSGTGPKAGGPRYMFRFATEKNADHQHGGDGRQYGLVQSGIVVFSYDIKKTAVRRPPFNRFISVQNIRI